MLGLLESSVSEESTPALLSVLVVVILAPSSAFPAPSSGGPSPGFVSGGMVPCSHFMIASLTGVPGRMYVTKTSRLSRGRFAAMPTASSTIMVTDP